MEVINRDTACENPSERATQRYAESKKQVKKRVISFITDKNPIISHGFLNVMLHNPLQLVMTQSGFVTYSE